MNKPPEKDDPIVVYEDPLYPIDRHAKTLYQAGQQDPNLAARIKKIAHLLRDGGLADDLTMQRLLFSLCLLGTLMSGILGYDLIQEVTNDQDITTIIEEVVLTIISLGLTSKVCSLYLNFKKNVAKSGNLMEDLTGVFKKADELRARDDDRN